MKNNLLSIKHIVILLSLCAIVMIAVFQNTTTLLDAPETVLPTPILTGSISGAPQQQADAAEQETLPFINLIVGTTAIELPFHTGDTLYHILESASKSGAIHLEGEYYQGLGFLVTSIGIASETLHGDLVYLINGIEATAGISTFVPTASDTIVWKKI